MVALFLFILVPRYPAIIDKDFYELEFGISFSPFYTTSLGIDAKEAYLYILDELKPASARLPVYWSEVEKENNLFDFTELDWYLREASKRKIKVVLTIGYRNFRFPECYPPEWAKDLDSEAFEAELLDFLSVAVNYFVVSEFNQAIEAWQVENEPFDLPTFRRWCKHFSSRLIEQEIEAVRAKDPSHRPVILTFGGEVFLRNLWERTIKKADVFGVSYYPRTVLPGGSVIQTYRLGLLSPRNIAKERQFATNLGKKFWVVEMQAEPWGGKLETISPEILRENYELLLELGGAERVYLWGAEWWYKKMKEGDSSIWQVAKELINP